MSYKSLLNKTVDIKRKTQTSDLQGGYTSTWATIHQSVKCRFYPLSSKEAMLSYNKASVFANYFIYLEYISGLAEGDRVYLGTRIFEIKLVIDWDETNKYMKLAAMEKEADET